MPRRYLFAVHGSEPEAGAAERWTLRLAERAAGLACGYHRARLHGARNLPTGGALLVGNHGVFGYETPVFFSLLHRETGRYPVGLADRGFFRLPVFRTVLPWVGGVEGTREQAAAALRGGALVVCYPGGAREVFKRPHARYRLRWERALGFARVAAMTGVPIVPFAGAGVDETFAMPGGKRWALRLSMRDARYTAPLCLPVPLPVRLTFAVGRPMDPPPPDATDEELGRFRDRVAGAVRRLLVERACDA